MKLQFCMRIEITVEAILWVFTDLRTVMLDFGICEGASTSTFSKLSGLIALKRCPNLAVTLVTKQASVYKG